MENFGSSVARHQQMENVLSSKSKAAAAAERKPRPKPEQKVDCPRCKSPNTKFCYYNNYSMTQPRYFCKACRRYWTHGGSLRNVPIGGGCRKSRRSSSSAPTTMASDANKLFAPPEPMVPPSTCVNFPNVLPTFVSAGFELPRDHHLSLPFMSSSSSSSSSSNQAMAMAPGGTTFLDVLRGGGFLDGHRQNTGYYGGGGMVIPPSTFGVGGPTPMQHGAIGHAIGGAAAMQGPLNGTMDAGEEGDGGVKAMMGIGPVGLQWQPQLGGGGGGVGSAGAQQQGTVNNVMMDNNSSSSNNNGGGDNGGSSRDCYWNNGGTNNPWQHLMNSSSLM